MATPMQVRDSKTPVDYMVIIAKKAVEGMVSCPYTILFEQNRFFLHLPRSTTDEITCESSLPFFTHFCRKQNDQPLTNK